MTEKQEEYKAHQEAPLSVVTVWGEIGSGKTLFGINSPYKPVMVFDMERGSRPYKAHFEFDRKEFTRWSGKKGLQVGLANLESGKYGTLVIDTATHLCEWVSGQKFFEAGQIKFSSGKTKAEVQSQLVWADAKQTIRDIIYSVYDKVQVVVLTAHARNKWGTNRREARVLDPIFELSDLVIQLIRKPNQKIPSGVLGTEETKSRIMALPPRLPQATWPVILDYITKKPADWDKLAPEELAPEVLYPIPSLEDEE